MTGIQIYVEGGGDGANGRAALRQGFDTLLDAQKQAARSRRLGWKTVLCGPRDEAFKAFTHATTNHGSEIVVLLVDAEEAVLGATPAGPSPATRVKHLTRRDRWHLTGIAADRVHLMTQCMEAWIVADTDQLATFYRKGFEHTQLPKRPVLDEEPKASVYAALKAATKATQKGSYGKIKHASELLRLVRPEVVATRCPSFRQLATWLDAVIAIA